MKNYRFLFSLIVLLSIAFPIFGNNYNSSHDMKNRTTQKTISEAQNLSDGRKLMLMTDGSIWLGKGWLSNPVNIEDFHNPEINKNYHWVDGYNRGFDEIWTENRVEARLLALDVRGFEDIPFDFFKRNFFVTEVLYDKSDEILILENNSLVVMPSYHGGFAAGEEIKVIVMKNGKNAYLLRQIDEENQVTIPLDRTSDHLFIAR